MMYPNAKTGKATRNRFFTLCNQAAELGIDLHFRKLYENTVIFERRKNGFYVHLATRKHLIEVNSFLQDLITVEGELQNG